MVRKRIKSFHYALQGLITGLRDQPNIKVHFLLGLIAIILGVYFQIPRTDWLILILTITVVLTLEFMNTAVEEIVDSFVDGIHPSAKKAKDVAAAAVFIASFAAFIIGIIIFLPYLYNLISLYPLI